MDIFIGILGIIIIAFILLDVFEFIVLPRSANSQGLLARTFLRFLGRMYTGLVRNIKSRSKRENLLSYFGPMALLFLFSLWAVGIIVGFGLVGWALGSRYAHGFSSTILTDMYTSGTTFFTLGFADITPASGWERLLSVLEAGVGFGFLGLVISYLPLFYQSFAGREVLISMLDEWAGSPPSAGELLRRLGQDQALADLEHFLHDWEEWTAELLERHLSYPILGAFRSQHENQSWVSALTMILDLCTLIQVGFEGAPERAGRLTFAIARHAVGDLNQVYHIVPRAPKEDRLPPAGMERLREVLASGGIRLNEGAESDQKLAELRLEYEPYVNSLAEFLVMELPPWFASPSALDNWQTTAWSGNGESHFGG